MRVFRIIMRIFKIFLIYFILLSILIMCQGIGSFYDESDNDLNVIESPVEIPEPDLFIEPANCFDYAELVTGFSAEILRGIAATESRFKTEAVGDGGMSFGMFQLHSRWYESRAEKWGEFDPTDPFESAVIAGRIMQENLIAFNGDLRLAIAAYRQGVSDVLRRGATQRYVDDVLNWQDDPEKMLSFFIFCGITDIEVLQDGYKDTGTQNTHKFNDSLAVQVSWRGSGGISY